MKLISAGLGIVQLLSVGVLSDNPNDETNINICLNINIGPGCTGGHCRPPPSSNNCNMNTSSGPEIVPEESDRKPTPTWQNPSTSASRPTTTSATSTTKSKTAKLILLKSGDDWESETMLVCYDATCKAYSRLMRYSHWVCLDDYVCHCYGHQPAMKNYGPGWMDEPRQNCSKQECANHCQNQGFGYSVCTGHNMCHCYKIGNPPKPITTKPVELQPIHQRKAEKPSTETSTAVAVKTAGPERRPWDDYPVENCSMCEKFCDFMGHAQGFCIEYPKTCHCYSCNTKGPKSGCAEKPLGNCNRGSCSETCQMSKFMQAFCKDSNTCHCYDHSKNEKKLMARSKQKLDDLNFKVLACSKSSCSNHCRMKEFSDGTCTNSTNCLCSWEPDGMDTSVKLCNRFSCTSFCTMMDYSNGTCTKMNNCQCSGGLVEKHFMRRSSRTVVQIICFDAICKVFCATVGSTEGVCRDKKTCKCGKTDVPLTNMVKHRLFHNNPLESQTLPSHTRDPLLDKTRDFVVEVCVLALCKHKCKRHNFRKGFCVEAGSRPRCHCYEAKRNK